MWKVNIICEFDGKSLTIHIIVKEQELSQETIAESVCDLFPYHNLIKLFEASSQT